MSNEGPAYPVGGVVALEMLSPEGFGRVRLHQVPDVSGASLLGFIRDVVAPGATVMTDGWSGYNGVAKSGYVHERTVISTSGSPGHVAMPGVHGVASLLKRWLLGTHQGAVSREHLNYYLDEYTFRFNRWPSRARGLLFHRLMEQLVIPHQLPTSASLGATPRLGMPNGGMESEVDTPFRVVLVALLGILLV